MKSEYVEFIKKLHGYTIRIKEIHWNTDEEQMHLKCDKALEELYELEDRFAESAMGVDDSKFQLFDLKPIAPGAEDLRGMVKELEQDVRDMKKKLDADKEGGLIHICDGIMEFCGKYKYRTTQK